MFLESFQTVVHAAHPEGCVADFIPAPPKGRMIVVGAGKASAAMAAAFEQHYKGVLEGLVITRYGHNVPTQHIRIVEAAHPVPDEAGQHATGEMLALLHSAGPDDLIVCLISGGGSALLSRPVEGVTFQDLCDVQKALLGSGASIHDMNIVRKHLNVALGGGLAQAAAHTPMVTLAISDVVGNDVDTIASGASVADRSTLKDAQDVLKKYHPEAPESIRAALSHPANETPKADDPIFKHNDYHMIATPALALEKAKTFWEAKGFSTHIWDTDIEGDSEEAAQRHVGYIQEILQGKTGHALPCAILSGGETTMTLTPDSGLGGPNTHFMLKAACLLRGQANIYGMACDTDGIDGHGDHAGAMITPEILSLAAEKGLDPTTYLKSQNSASFFDSVGYLVKTGATYTNVNDYRVFLLLP